MEDVEIRRIERGDESVARARRVPVGVRAARRGERHAVGRVRVGGNRFAQLDPTQLAIWISAAPDPQRTALALFYLDEFDHQEVLALTELKTAELANLIADGRQQFQAWLNATVPPEET